MPATDPAARTLGPDLAARRDAAVAAWRGALAEVEQLRATTTLRELRIDLDRRLAALHRQGSAIEAAVERPHAPTAVVVARDARAAGRLAEAVGVPDAELLDNGADAVGLALACQPELVVVDSPLEMMAVHDVVVDLRRWVPDAVVVACSDGVGPAELLAAGADAVYRRGAPPADVARALELSATRRDEVPQPR